MLVLTTQGVQVVDRSTLSDRSAMLVGQHWNAIKAIVNETTSRYDIQDFEGVTIAPGMERETSEDFIYDMLADGEFDYDDIYAG
jgi:hypothetical protein